MNKLFAALMTAMILGTVAVVFVLGLMSLGGLPENTTPEAEQITPDSGLTYGTDFTDWQYLTSVGQTWLRGESVLSAPARWQEDFGVFVVDVDLSTWEWRAARQLQQSVADSP